MKTHIRSVLLSVAAFGITSVACAYPSIRVEEPGSAIIIYMANAEDRPYNCTISYSWAYDSFGETKTGSESFSIGAGAKQGEAQVHRFSGSYVHLRVTSGPNLQCNPS